LNPLSELRSIIVGEQKEELDKLKNRVEESQVDAEKVSHVLADSVRLSMQSNSKLQSELKPYVSKTVINAVENDPEKFAAALYPALLPAVKLMIASSMRSFVQSFSQVVESATTITGLKWRFEAARKGVPYSEVALRKNLEYRVEQVYLFERDAGILVEHLVNDNVQGMDSDAVAGMFAAIQSFVRDSFTSGSEENLTEIHVGDLDVWLVHGPYTTLACVIRGNAPYELRDQLDRIHDRIYSEYSLQLKKFDGSKGSINGVSELLEPSLQIKLKELETKKNNSSVFIVYILIFVTLMGLAVSGFYNWRQNVIKDKVEGLLHITPGVVPTKLEWVDKKLHVYGLMFTVLRGRIWFFHGIVSIG